MNRFARVLCACALLIAPGAYADNYPWDGDTDNKFETGTNWTGSGFPGAGNPPRIIDRAEFNTDTNNDTILFDSSSGVGNCDCRTIVEFFMDADAATVALELRVTGDLLNIDQFYMISGADGSETATLEVNGGELDIRALNVTSNSTNAAVFDIVTDLKIAGASRMTGNVDISVTSAPTQVI